MNEPRWPVITGAITGTALAAVGVVSLLREPADTNPAAVLRWVVGLAVVHDVVLVPAVLVVGVVVRRWAPSAWLAAALLVSGVVTLVAFPFVRGYGRLDDNPSILPRNYARGLALVLVLSWLIALGAALVARWTGKRLGHRPR